MSSLAHLPHNPQEENSLRSLQSQNLMVPLGKLGWVGLDLCRDTQSRARIVSLAAEPDSVAIEGTALWIYTGIHTLSLESSLSFARRHRRASASVRRRFDDVDICVMSGLTITTPERTAIDLLRKDAESGLGHLFALIRSGANFASISARAKELYGVPGMQRARKILRQLPDDAIERASSMAPTIHSERQPDDDSASPAPGLTT